MSWVALVVLALFGVSPLFLLPAYGSIFALLLFLPFFFGVGLPVSLSFLRSDPRDPLFAPLSLVSGIVWMGTIHLLLLHLGGRALSPYLLVAGGALGLWVYRRDLARMAPRPGLGKALLVVAVVAPQFLLTQFRSWSSLVGPDGGLVNFFNATQSVNVGVIRDVAEGIPIKSSVIYPLVATYHVGGHALVDLFRVLANLTPFEANFIVVNLFVVGMGELALLWLISRWFCERFWSRLLLLAALSFLSGEALRVFLMRRKLISGKWVVGGDHGDIFSFPYISTNVPRMVSLFLVLWLVYVIFERLRQDRPAGLGWAIALGALLGSVYYYKNSALVPFLAGLALVAGYRAFKEKQVDLCVVVGTGVLTGLLIHLAVFSYGGSYGVGVELQVIRSWGVVGGPLFLGIVAYLVGWNFRVLGAVALVAGWREIRSNRLLMPVVLLLLGTLGSGFFLSNFLTHSLAADPSLPKDSPFHYLYAVSQGGYSVQNPALRQFIHVPHAFVSVFLLGFLVRWIERSLSRGGAPLSWAVALLFCLAIVGSMTVGSRAFAYVQKPHLANADLRAALGVIPKENSFTAANFVGHSVVSIEGHRFYHQPTAFFNYGSLRHLLHERADHQYRLFSNATPDGAKREILGAMGVSHLLIDKEAGGSTEIPGCPVYYDNRRYRVCRVVGS